MSAPIGRPRRHDNRTSTGLRIDTVLWKRLQAEADARDVSTNWMVCKAVEQFLERLIPVEEMKWTL